MRPLVSALVPELTCIRVLGDNLHWLSQASGDIRIFKRDSARNRLFAQGGHYLRVFFGEDNRHSLMFGGRYLGNYAHHRRHSYQGFELMAHLNVAVT